ncbi:MAG TPA: hypothetical protein PLT94_17885, partial [Rhodocyclaceae bacterium]|nr:hypothetical protein [Rhodocyclaceae bacterium]
MRQRVIPFLICCLYGVNPGLADAAQNLPPFAVDPGLLGGAPSGPAAAPAARDAGRAKQPSAAPVAPSATDAPEPAAATAEPDPFPAPKLKSGGMFPPLVPGAGGRPPVFFTADKLTGQGENETIAEGAVEVRKEGVTLTADKLTYWQIEDEAEAEGNVKIV